MNWKLKAGIQNLVSIMPESISSVLYYQMQRHFASLRKTAPISRFRAAIDTWDCIVEQGYEPKGKAFLEIGTGRVPIVPLAYYLMGASKTYTIDVNLYLKKELILESLNYISANSDEIIEIFGFRLEQDRFKKLLDWHSRGKFEASEFFNLCKIHYIAPADAADTLLADESVDFHTSYTVLEHISPNSLQDILREGKRVVREGGLFIHRVDYSDHFSHLDSNISAINFLQYSDSQWSRYASNQFMYMNRLRHDDFLDLFCSNGFELLDVRPRVDPAIVDLLASPDFELDEQYIDKPKEVLSIIDSWIVAR